jgi:glycyl-tRNA synthetase beta chain
LPDLTRQIGDAVAAGLAEARLNVDAPMEAYSTPRRLTVCNGRVAERQTDLEEVLNGPPVSAAFDAAGEPTPAASGFARRHGVEVSALEQVSTAKGPYLAFRKRERGKPSVDVLPDVLAGVLRALSFPKAMHWDAWLDDGRGELLFGRPIRWILFLYGGRVVPFEIRRTESAQSPQVQDVRSAAVTYGHRFLTTSGRAGRAIKVRSFEDYRARLLEHFVVLDRSERHDRIARELEAKARKLNGRVASHLVSRSALLEEVPDLIEYPAVIAGIVQEEFLRLPPEVLTTTLVHHQHYFPVVDESGHLKNAFLAVTNTDSANEKIVARNAERVVAARLRDARFFWETDRKIRLEDRVERLDTILFHRKLGTYRAKAERIAALAAWVAAEALESRQAAEDARTAGRLAKADLVTDMVREFPELQGTMGGIYAREEGMAEPVWKAIYSHYLPASIEIDAPPSRRELGSGAVTWAAVSLADKLDSVVGMFTAGERPTGSRDPLGLRRQAQGVVKILADLPELAGITTPISLGPLLARAAEPFGGYGDAAAPLLSFMSDRVAYLLEQRGFDVRAVRAVMHGGVERLSPYDARKKLEALAQLSGSEALLGVATLLKRVKNITKGIAGGESLSSIRPALKEPAEQALAAELESRAPVIRAAADRRDYKEAFANIAQLQPAVAKFFDDVLVMADDERLRAARLALVAVLRDLILDIADISEIVTDPPTP